MRLLIVGSDKVYAIENFYVKYLRELGVTVSHFPAQSIFYDYYQKNIINKLIFKSGISGILKKINNKFKNEIKNFKPDVVWIFKGMEIFPESLNWVKSLDMKLVNYNGDSPFIFSGKGSGNANVTDSVQLYDLHLTYNTAVKSEMEIKYHIPTAILPFGFNISADLFEKCSRQEEIMKACFLGNPDEYRGRFIQRLAEKGIELDVYGNDWQKFVNHSNIKIFSPVYGDDFWLILHKYRIQLNLLRPHNPDTHNMRTFEIGGVGGIQLAPVTPDHLKYFESGKEIFLFQEIQECVEQINKILAITKEGAKVLRMSARKRSLESGYSYKDRARQALKEINLIFE